MSQTTEIVKPKLTDDVHAVYDLLRVLYAETKDFAKLEKLQSDYPGEEAYWQQQHNGGRSR